MSNSMEIVSIENVSMELSQKQINNVSNTAITEG